MRTDRVCSLLVVLGFCVSSMFAQSVATSSAEGCKEDPNLPNVNQLALLRWYGANVVTSFSLGGAPNGIAFDGANMWVVNGPVTLFRSCEPMMARCWGRFRWETYRDMLLSMAPMCG
jgi:hypothetical protein